MADLDRYLTFLAAAGVEFEIAPDLVEEPDHFGPPHANDALLRDLRIEGLPTIREHRAPGSSRSACHATFSVARAMTRPGIVRAGEPFWDVGCGTGVLAIAAALLGARPVLATDVDRAALELARENVASAGVAVDVEEGSLLEWDGPAGALLSTNLPHKPIPTQESLPLAQAGGPDGDGIFSAMLDQAARLPDPLRVLFFLHSLPHPRLLARIGREYRLTLLSTKRRFLGPGEYGPLQDLFVERHRAGTSYLAQTADGRRYLACGIWLAERR